MQKLPEGYLQHDHQAIMRMLTQVEGALQQLAATGTLPNASLHALVRRLDDEVERHFMKEELVLGPVLSQVEPDERAALSEILQDHERLRQEMGAFRAAVELHEEGHLRPKSTAQSKLILRGLDLVRSLVQHMQREESSSFLDAERQLSSEQRLAVAQQLREAAVWEDLAAPPELNAPPHGGSSGSSHEAP
ncbi:MAG: hemerythrin domain-containing protein [Candidatus Tectomicrobia bacterium]|nr:hemerythrin domain-containing protein [Candidatus Tectomicrobia bacterium]